MTTVPIRPGLVSSVWFRLTHDLTSHLTSRRSVYDGRSDQVEELPDPLLLAGEEGVGALAGLAASDEPDEPDESFEPDDSFDPDPESEPDPEPPVSDLAGMVAVESLPPDLDPLPDRLSVL